MRPSRRDRAWRRREPRNRLVHYCHRSKTRQPARPMDLDLEAIKARLEQLRSEHRDLDDAIARISETVPFDTLQVQRLKKRKLLLKDLIIKLENQLVPDIIA